METRSYPSEGIRRLVIEQAAGDARVRGAAETALVTIVYRPAGRADGEPFAVDGDTLRFAGGPVARVDLPPALALTLADAAGDLWVEDLAAALELGAVHGDLRLRGLAGAAVVGTVDGDLRVDRAAALEIQERCAGDLRAQAVGRLAVAAVSGDLRAFELESLQVGNVHGDLWAEKVAGPVAIEQAGGDLHLNDVTGAVSLGQVAGDLRLGGLLAGLETGRVAGDADLHGPFAGENSYGLAANGDVALYLPAEVNLRLTVSARGRIRSDLQLTPAADGSGTFTAALGRDGARVALQSRGDLRIAVEGGRAANEPYAGLGERIRQQIEAVSSMDLDALGDRIRQQVQASLSAAGIDRETGRMNMERGPRGRGPRPGPRGAAPTSPPPPGGTPAERPARPAEQMAILKMLEEGTITAAEAEMLLKALG